MGEIPVEVPLMRSLWLAKKAGRKRALRWVRDAQETVKTKTIEVIHVEDGQPVTKRVKRPLLEIFEPAKDSEVEGGTVARGSATCPATGFTTKVDSVRAQLKQRRGGAADARLFCVVTTRADEKGRFYRLPAKRLGRDHVVAPKQIEGIRIKLDHNAPACIPDPSRLLRRGWALVSQWRSRVSRLLRLLPTLRTYARNVTGRVVAATTTTALSRNASRTSGHPPWMPYASSNTCGRSIGNANGFFQKPCPPTVATVTAKQMASVVVARIRHDERKARTSSRVSLIPPP